MVFLVLNFYGIFCVAFILPEGRIVSFIGKWNVEVNTNIYGLWNIFHKLGFSCIACFLARFFNEVLLL